MVGTVSTPSVDQYSPEPIIHESYKKWAWVSSGMQTPVLCSSLKCFSFTMLSTSNKAFKSKWKFYLKHKPLTFKRPRHWVLFCLRHGSRRLSSCRSYDVWLLQQRQSESNLNWGKLTRGRISPVMSDHLSRCCTAVVLLGMGCATITNSQASLAYYLFHSRIYRYSFDGAVKERNRCYSPQKRDKTKSYIYTYRKALLSTARRLPITVGSPVH